MLIIGYAVAMVTSQENNQIIRQSFDTIIVAATDKKLFYYPVDVQELERVIGALYNCFVFHSLFCKVAIRQLAVIRQLHQPITSGALS